ncbi:MAG: hypothetical protein IJ408_01715 [Clostridia bacterium]|nr:hypothetical protein [Clostridia bacterium]
MSFIRHNLRSASADGSGIIACDKLLGIDSTLTEDMPSLSRADGVSYYDGTKKPGLLNMVRSAIGEVSKRPGYKHIEKPERLGDINGVFVHKNPGGNRYFFVTNNVICVLYESYGVDHVFEIQGNFINCYGFQAGNYMFIMNGYQMYIYDCINRSDLYFNYAGLTSVIEPSLSYLPTTYIAGSPSGDAAPYEAANYLNPYIAEQYIGDGTSKEFTVHFPLESVYAAYIKNEKGEWTETETAGISERKVKLKTAPPKPSVTGEDNVRIVYRRPSDDYECGDIACCRCGSTFGVGGFEDRVFLSGNNLRKGYVYYSEMNNPTYFPETNYIKVGTNGTVVNALYGYGNTLAVMCNDNVYSVRGAGTGDNEDTAYVETAIFKISEILKSPDPIALAPVVFDNEINYLTKDGVCAITASGILDERCCQIRSSYINKFLLEEDLAKCKMITYKDFLVISNRKGRLYLLDGKQFSANADKPFSYRQYEGYIWDGIPALYIWEHKGRLCFSDSKDIFGFDKDFENTVGNYCDEYVTEEGGTAEKPILAYWETPEIYCSNFNFKKFFTRFGVLLESHRRENGAYEDTDIKVSIRFDNDDWRTVKDYDGKRRKFDYSLMDYQRLTFRNKPQSPAVYGRNLHKKGRSVKLRFENGNLYEPFVLKGFNLEYLQM